MRSRTVAAGVHGEGFSGTGVQAIHLNSLVEFPLPYPG